MLRNSRFYPLMTPQSANRNNNYYYYVNNMTAVTSLIMNIVTFRPRSTSVAGTVSNAEGFVCCCRATENEDGWRVCIWPGSELAAIAIGALYLAIIYALGLFNNLSLLRNTLGPITISGSMVEWRGAAVISRERLQKERVQI